MTTVRESAVADRLSAAAYKRLRESSGDLCAYTGCARPVTLEEHGAARELREAAYVVSESCQGPRWRVPADTDERRSSLNHVLLCREHRTIVDSAPRVYSVGVLVKMKLDHEARFGRDWADRLPFPVAEEEVRLAALAVVGVPAAVYTASALKEDFPSTCRAILHRGYRPGRDDLTPFLHLKQRIWAFHDLSRPDGPFAKVVQRNTTIKQDAREMWSSVGGQRQYRRLLDKVLNLHLIGRGLEWDKERDRYWFPPEDGGQRVAEVQTRSGDRQRRFVAYEQKHPTGALRGLWRHWALECRFAPVGDGWALTTRPTYQWTWDGSTPLDVGLMSRSTERKLGGVYHAQYLDQVAFWQSWLTRGRAELVSPVAHAALVVSAEAPATTIVWPAIGDRMFTPLGPSESNLQTLLEYQQALDLDPDEILVDLPDPELAGVGGPR
jgi:hypothetical protein